MTGYPTSLGSTDTDTIQLLGQDLAQDLMGSVGFAELAYWLVTLRRPTPGELRVLEAVLVALADHGLTPSAIAARLTLTGAPESVQGALAAGLLGGGSRYLGVTEDAGRFLSEALAAHDATGVGRPTSVQAWDDLARAAIREQLGSGRYVPGLGHPEHKAGDPRTPVLLRIAAEEGQLGPHLELFTAVGRVHPEVLGRVLPLNGAGACGAALCDIGLPVGILRGFALLARTAGLLGHLAEEMRRPIGQAVADDVRRATAYEPTGPEETRTVGSEAIVAIPDATPGADAGEAAAPRSRALRRRDTEHRLAHDVDLWVASASPEGAPWLVPLSFDWDGEALLLATPTNSPTGTNLATTRTVRLGLGPTRDVTMVEGDVQLLEMDALPRERGDRFAARTGFDPRELATAYRWFRITPRRIQAWREEDELADRELMRDGRWLV